MTAKPARIQLRRKRGFRLQDASHALNGLPATGVARPSPLGNPFIVGRDGDHATCAELYRGLAVDGVMTMTHSGAPDLVTQRRARKMIAEALPGLRGRNLACWCGPGSPCHADVLLELANSKLKASP